MKKQKFLSIPVILGVVLGMMAGCAPAPSSNPVAATTAPATAAPAATTAPATAAPATAAPATAAPATAAPVAQTAPTEISMWSFIQQHIDYFQTMATRWNGLHPDKPIKLVTTFYDWASLHDKLYAAQIAGQGIPDIADVEMGKWPMFMNGDIQFLDLTSYVQPYAKDLITSILDEVSKDGKLYAAPSHVGATVMYYNTELLGKAGIDYKTIVTWDDFEKAMKTYHDKTGKFMTYVETYGGYQYMILMAEMGSDIIDGNGMPNLDTPTSLKAVQLIRKWVDEGIIGTIPTGNADTPEGKAAVANGDVAAVGYPLWYMNRFTDEMPNLKGKIAIAPLPVFDANSYKSVGLGGTGTTVYKKSPNADLAAQFVVWAKLSPEGSAGLWKILGFDPVNKLVAQDKSITTDPNNKFLQYFETNPFDVLAAVSDKLWTDKTMQNAGIINDYLSATTWNKIYGDKVDPKTELNATQKELMAQSKQP